MDETHFQSVHLAPSKISWLKAHNSLEKVLNLTCLAYAAAPKWEPYPQGLLSVEDLQKMEHEKKTHRKAIEEANRLSQLLLVRKGDNVDPTQEIVEYGMRNTSWVAAQLARAKNKSSQKKKKKGETVEALITAATSEPFFFFLLLLVVASVISIVEPVEEELVLSAFVGCGEE